MRTFEQLADAYTVLLAEHDLPSMSADDLWFELIAVRDGEASSFIPAHWAASRDRAAIQAAADAVKAFWDEWEAMEQRRSRGRGQ